MLKTCDMSPQRRKIFMLIATTGDDDAYTRINTTLFVNGTDRALSRVVLALERGTVVLIHIHRVRTDKSLEGLESLQYTYRESKISKIEK
jgi:hypothetical protein